MLALLGERPMHGYEMLQELGERTQDVRRPSPGSLYPALQPLEDQGLVRTAAADGRRRFELMPRRAGTRWTAARRGRRRGRRC